MPSERFYISADLIKGERVSLTGQELHHLAHVMRVRIGEEVELVNGKGAIASARLTALDRHEALLEILNANQQPLPPPRIILAIPMMRPAKLEWVIEKGTELGADAFWIYPADLSEKENLSEHQFERLIHIAISAMKQCGRLDLPEIKRMAFKDLFSMAATYLFGDTDEKAPWLTEITPPAVFITGPEKGFSEKELKILKQKASGVRIHQNILRAETAPIAAAVLLFK